ncbi:hypothetical protein [Kitasatospora sp. DSM 101779]|uniref:hypothetical protein n=1 Tax=Kitasatospora sp. DSM 101779 TaxID=2853165 RepID=UPI0021DA3A45|nr:hypothetical protein [Kitasatospora sp. DSM 101779]MCU7820122.1 hypothetical protein [Kitasatospora sp. DSM 101779]
MFVYVGIDALKRSQIAVIDEVGEVEVNPNVPNGVETVLGGRRDPRYGFRGPATGFPASGPA